MKIRQLFLLFFLAFALLAIAGIPIRTQVEIEAGGNNPFIAGRNVNMVSGIKLPFGDPWLQRQNEPSIAVSTRNPMHLFAGANDYRTIDVPDQFELPGIQAAANAHDAWLGVYESFDGGQSWITTLLHGYPQDLSLEGLASPINGFETACDPIVRAGANGLFYYCGIAFNRTTKASAIFVARYVDNNNLEKVEVKIDQGVRKYFGPIQYKDTKLVATGSTSSSFIDMPNLAVDIPRKGALYGNVYVAYIVFSNTGESSTADKIFFQRSTDGGVTWSTPPVQLSANNTLVQRPVIAIDPSDLKGNTIYVAFRRFARGTVPNGIVIVKSTDGGKTFGRPSDVAALPYPFDQGTSNYSFRTNSYPTMAVDGLGKVYVAWSQRQGGSSGQARIVISAIPKINLLGGVVSASDDIGNVQESGAAIESNNFQNVQSPDFQLQGSLPVWSTPKVVDQTYTGIGHQFMPSLTFAGWKLMLAWYDQREDLAKDASNFIVDSPGEHRHTIDVRAAEGTPGVPPSFSPSIQLSRYLYVLDLDSNGNPIEEGGYYKVIQAESNPINYPLFQLGTVPFHGDYMEITPSPRILPPAVAFGYWIYNINPLEPTIFHAAWADNRDVRPPNGDIWGDWTNYNAPNSQQDPDWQFPPPPICSNGSNTGMRNQNVYTANINKGIIVGSPGNTKQLDLSSSSEGGRTFVVFIKNTTDVEKSLNLLILEIGGVNASFDQFKNDDLIKVKVGPYSSVSTTVYVDRSTRSLAPVTVNAFEGLKLMGYVILNPDPTNLPLSDPNNPFQNLGHETHNPDVSAPSVWNYDLGNQSDPDPSGILTPRVQNPRVQNYSVVNPRVQNTGVLNPRVQNESIVNNEVGNPRVQNTEVPNGALTDVTWTVTNDGNTTSAYTFNIRSNVPDNFNGANPPLIAQVLVYKVHKVPVDKDCQLYETHQDELMVNVSNPRVQNPRVQNSPLNTQASSPITIQAADLSAQDITFNLAPGDQADVIFRVWDQDTTDGSVAFNPNMVIAETVAEAVNTDDAIQGSTTPPYDTPPNSTPWTTPSPTISTAPPAMSFSASLGGGNPAPQMLDIWNSGGDNLSYTVGDDATWLSVYPDSGTSNGNHNAHSVSVDIFGLAAGTYTGTITISSPYATNNPMRVPVTLAIYATPPSGEWVVRHDGPIHADDNAVALATDSAGNVYVTGASTGSGSGQDILTIKYNALGSVVWTARYDAGHSAPNNNESPTAIAVDSAGNVYVTGTQQDGAYSNRDWITIKYSNLGVQQWAMDFDRNAIVDDIPRAIAVDLTGNVYVTGESAEAPSVVPDFVTIKYGPSGNQIWASSYVGFSGSDMAKALALDSSGNVYVAGTSSGLYGYFDYALVKYDNSGAKVWAKTYNGPVDGNDEVSVMAVDSSGNIYVSGSSEGDTTSFDYCTMKFDSNGEVLWIRRYDRVGGHDLVNAMAVDSSGNVYVTGRSDYGLGEDPLSDYATVKYDSSGTQQWVALYDGPDQVQDVARAIAIDPAGNVYVAGESDGVGTSFDYATIRYDGNGDEIWVRRYNGPGNFNDSAAAVVIDPAGNVLITGTSTGSGTGTDFATIKYNPLGPPINTIAGNGTAGYSGDGDPATSASLKEPSSVAFDSAGNLYICDSGNYRVRKVEKTGIITTFAGNGTEGYGGDGGPATSASLNYPMGVVVDSAGNFYIADTNNHRVRKVNSSGIITTIAGTGTPGYEGDGGNAASAKLYYPRGLALDAPGNLYIADSCNFCIRKVNLTGIISTVAGTGGVSGYSGDGGPAINAQLSYSHDVFVDTAENLFIADYGNNCIRKVNLTGIISTVAGNRIAGYSGDGGPATNASMRDPQSAMLDTSGNLLVADGDNRCVRRVDAHTGIIMTISGNGHGGYSGDGGPAVSAVLSAVYDLAIDTFGNIYIADYENHRIRKISISNE